MPRREERCLLSSCCLSVCCCHCCLLLLFYSFFFFTLSLNGDTEMYSYLSPPLSLLQASFFFSLFLPVALLLIVSSAAELSVNTCFGLPPNAHTNTHPLPCRPARIHVDLTQPSSYMERDVYQQQQQLRKLFSNTNVLIDEKSEKKNVVGGPEKREALSARLRIEVCISADVHINVCLLWLPHTDAGRCTSLFLRFLSLFLCVFRYAQRGVLVLLVR